MGTYKINFDKSKCMYFLINEEKVFDKCYRTWEKLAI